MTFYPKN